MPLRLVFMGTPDFAVPTLAAILGAGHAVACVYSQPPRAAGRGQKERRAPVHEFAAGAGLPVATPQSLRDADEQRAFAALGADAAVAVAYGLILPNPILAAPSLGCFNLHASLLPRWRGAAPINRAIMAGDSETGVMVMKMAEGLDTGPIAMAERVAIGPDTTAGELHDELARRGADLMVRALGALERGALTLTPQAAEGVSYAAKIANAETRIDWSQPWKQVHDRIRGLSPFPGAWFEMPVGREPVRIKVLRTTRGEGAGAPGAVLDGVLTVACGEGAVRIVQLQRAGRQAMTAEEFLRGVPLAPGTRLT
jgi:methionyl-tRNA formyltransferase